MTNFRFNEFFYRKLKSEARPCTAPDNPAIAVSPADCRSVVFNEIDKATKVWIKGKDFNMKRLLGTAYPDEAAKFEGGALGIFRLAPQDYHRFHVPVDGVIGEPKAIEGQYYTVNPMAIRSSYVYRMTRLTLVWMFMERMYELLFPLIRSDSDGCSLSVSVL